MDTLDKDNIITKESVLTREVSSFQGEKLKFLLTWGLQNTMENNTTTTKESILIREFERNNNV